MLKKLRNKRGFTIIEIMVVIALIGILAAVLVPKFSGVKERAKEVGVITNAKMVEAFVSTQIDSGLTIADLVDAIEDEFTENPLVNPFTHDNTVDASAADSAGAVTGVADSGISVATGDAAMDDPPISYDGTPAGVVVVTVFDDPTDGLTAVITGFNGAGAQITGAQRTISEN